MKIVRDREGMSKLRREIMQYVEKGISKFLVLKKLKLYMTCQGLQQAKLSDRLSKGTGLNNSISMTDTAGLHYSLNETYFIIFS